MKVLITGAAGFVAPHVAEEFRKNRHQVLLTDITNRCNMGQITVADLTSLEDMLRVTEGIDVVCHLGGIGDIYKALASPSLAASANVLGTANVLEACEKNSVRKVVYASTWEVYGRPHYQPVDEEHPCEPDHPYGITKLAGERLVIAFDKLKGVPGIALRMGTAFGIGIRSNTVFSVFIRRAMAQQPITISGSGLQTRQFTHVSDIARAFYLAATSDIHREVINTVAAEPISISELAQLITEELPTETIFGESRPGDVQAINVSSVKAERCLGWKAMADFRQALREMIAWHLTEDNGSRATRVRAEK
jgi:UDP-glucose 4-epimerase